MTDVFKVGDRVFVRNARVHPYTGTVIGILPRRVRVEFPHGGFGNTPYIEDFYPNRLIREEHDRGTD